MEANIARAEASKPEDIAPLVVWLASDDAANVTGRTFYVKTGLVALYSEPVMEKSLAKAGAFTIDEMFQSMPSTLAEGLSLPAVPGQ